MHIDVEYSNMAIVSLFPSNDTYAQDFWTYIRASGPPTLTASLEELLLMGDGCGLGGEFNTKNKLKITI